MANISVTAANVIDQAGATILNGYRAGATITAGQPVYLDSATLTWKLGQATSQTLALIKGIALGGASSGQWLAVQTDGDINLGATLVATTSYVVSATAGAIAPQVDIITPNWVSLIGQAISTSILRMKINPAVAQL